jgi:leucyl/phenylalanyl-tRNA---protein transferase
MIPWKMEAGSCPGAGLLFLLHHSPSILFAGCMSRTLPMDLLLEAYASGVFPMGMDDGTIRWFSPDPRGILPLGEFHVPHGLKRALKRPGWELRTDTAFDEVVGACAARDDTWITPLIRKAYRELFEEGHAHSVEIWKEGRLAGGLYGVALGGAFFGESMFHRVTDASKVALWHLVRILRETGFTLLDTQWTTEHLEQFGAREIPREEYLALLSEALRIPAVFPRIGNA